jgi:hypothetical protein
MVGALFIIGFNMWVFYILLTESIPVIYMVLKTSSGYVLMVFVIGMVGVYSVVWIESSNKIQVNFYIWDMEISDMGQFTICILTWGTNIMEV